MIYLIKNLVTNDTYVGYTSLSLKERFQKHLYNHVSGQTYLYRAMRKYGTDNFSIEILKEDGTYEDEKYFIESMKPTYNMTMGGEGGYTADSINFKMSMKEYHSKKDSKDYATYGMLGKKHSEENKRKMSKIKKEYWNDEQKKAAAAERIKGKNNPMYGKSPKNSVQITVDGVEYKSLTAASKALNISVFKLKKEHLYHGKN